ncbi:hypothetical protein ACI77O_12180 [Pseudomonas tritici]|uniref:hypothetical protein n=1 Tax=Pseudomonas tritici TaxID=2745518 RepID=UPI00387B8590
MTANAKHPTTVAAIIVLQIIFGIPSITTYRKPDRLALAINSNDSVRIRPRNPNRDPGSFQNIPDGQ